MENKITTRQTLQKLQTNLRDKNFRKEFGKLIVSYFDTNNSDTTAFYYKILKLLQGRGFNKEEAEDFFKDLRVKNKDTMVKLAKIQREIHNLQQEYKKNRIKILINPFSLTTMLNLYLNLYAELSNKIAKLKEEMLLKLKTNVHLDKKIREIEQIISKNLQGLQEMQEEKEDNKVTKLNNIYKDTQELQEKLEDLQETLVLQELDNTISGKEEKEQNQEHQDQYQEQNNHSSPKQVHQNIQEELEDCLKSIATNTNITDKKTLAFLTMGEYLHRGNKTGDKELFKYFNGVLDRKEFNAVIDINKMLLSNKLDYSQVKEALDKQGFKGLMELGENISIKQQKDKLDKEKDKEIGIGQPSKINLSMPSLN